MTEEEEMIRAYTKSTNKLFGSVVIVIIIMLAIAIGISKCNSPEQNLIQTIQKNK